LNHTGRSRSKIELLRRLQGKLASTHSATASQAGPVEWR
jgi:hypothetical protein